MNEVSKGQSTMPKLRLWLPLCIAVVTFLCYSYTLHNQFTNWDDDLYVSSPYIKSLSGNNLKMMLLHNITNNYYHPLTMLSLAADYALFKTAPFGYYFTNVVLHVGNTCLMFFLVLMLLEAMEAKGYGAMHSKEWLAVFGALCYGVHPMHVESVSWIAERKDVLYALFYFAGLITYLKYLDESKTKWLVYTSLLFMCSLLSKPMAVVFPLSAFAIDILLKRKISRKSLLEKAPLFIIALGAGLWAFIGQRGSGAMSFPHPFTMWEKVMHGSYGFIMYIFKAFIPINLSSFYPYPTSSYPTLFYIAPFIAAAIVAGLLFLAYKSNENLSRLILFGLGFYIVNVVFVLQFIPSGPTVMADRYTYVSYLGVFFIPIYLLQQLWEKRPEFHTVLKIAPVAFISVMAILCYNRTKVWHNTETLFKDVIAKYPLQVQTAYNNLGNYYAEKGDIADAYMNYKTLTDMQTANPVVYNNLANIYSHRHQFDSALMAYTTSLKLDSSNVYVYIDRGITYARLHNYNAAILDYNHAFLKDSAIQKLLTNRANAYFMLKQYGKCADDYSRAIRLNPAKADYYYNRGIAEMDMHNYDAALQDFTQDLHMDPNNLDCVFDLSLLYKDMGNYPKALNYAVKARISGYKVDDEYINNLQQSVNSSSE